MASTQSDMSGQTKDPDLNGHGIMFVHIAGDDVEVECHCGWKSVKYRSETEARAEFNNHVGGE